MVTALVSLALAADRTACVDPAAAAARYDASGTFDGVRRTEHFEIDYDEGSEIVSDAYLDMLADALEVIWATEVEDLGWPAPEGSDDHYVQVVLANLPADVEYGGVALREDCDGDVVGYFVLNTDFWYRSVDYISDVPAHEFNHLCQYASAPAFAQDEDSAWFYEATAVWIEDRVFEDTNTYAYDFFPEYLADPEAGLTDFVYATGPQYAHFVWDRYVDEYAGGPELLLAAWTESGPTVLDTFDQLFAEADEGDVATQWAGFLARAAALDFADHDVLVDAWTRSGEPYFAVDGDVPASGDSPADPDRLGAAYLHLVAPEGQGIRFTLTGDADDGWVAGGTDGTDVVTAQAEDGALTLDLAGSEAWIGVGPTAHNARPWTWSAEAVAPEEVGKEEPEEVEGGCGCGGGSPVGWVWIAALGVALHRRLPSPRPAGKDAHTERGEQPGPSGRAPPQPLSPGEPAQAGFANR